MNLATAPAPSPLERIVSRDRQVMAVGLAAVTALAWVYLVRSAAAMNAASMEAQMHAAMGMAMTQYWGLVDWLNLFLMWAIMMVAMMVPSAAPVMLLVLGTYRRRNDRQARASASMFVAGYLLAWTTFSAVVSALQVALHQAALLAADMRIGAATLAGVVMLLAGLYQWLPVKEACLAQCRSPLGLISRYWREGPAGGLSMGVRHGLYCVGCCWLLMALLFVVGVMNLVWVGAIAGLVFLEKLVRGGPAIGRLAGLVMGGWGFYLIALQ
jgi:predicted metal-binding membrane protein